jgi:hypothetical protein
MITVALFSVKCPDYLSNAGAYRGRLLDKTPSISGIGWLLYLYNHMEILLIEAMQLYTFDKMLNFCFVGARR